MKHALLTILTCVTICSCTIAQHNTDSGPPSTVGNDQDSGYIGTLGIGQSFEGYVIEKGFVDHYNGLVEFYGALPQQINNQAIGFIPAIKVNDGIKALPDGEALKVWARGKPIAVLSTGKYLIDDEHMKKYVKMRGWDKNGIARQNTLRTILPQ